MKSAGVLIVVVCDERRWKKGVVFLELSYRAFLFGRIDECIEEEEAFEM